MTREEHISNLETIGCDGWTVTTEAYKSLQFAIEALEQEPKTGHWIALENRFKSIDTLKCSECGQVFVVGEGITRNYCPNCGAKMAESEG